MKEVTPFYSVVVVFSKNKKQILLGKRREDKLWTSPAGGGEEGESPKECAIRELHEEANIACKEQDLKFLTSLSAKNGKPIFIFTTCLDSKKDIHVKNDPDKEVPSWNWYNLDAMPKLEEERLKTVNMAKMKMKDLIKSIVSTDMFTGVDLNTQDYSQDDMASRDTYWFDAITALVDDVELNVPVETDLEEDRILNVIKIGEGLYSGNIKDKESGDKILNFNELSIASLVQTLKAKEFIGKNESYKKEAPPEGDSDVKVEAPGIEGLGDLLDKLKNVHVEGDLNITIRKSLYKILGKLRKGGRTATIGEVRQWSNGKYIKHADGWVKIGGEHHGKLMGKFKGEAKEHHLELADKDKQKERLTDEQKIDENSKRIKELTAKLKAKQEEAKLGEKKKGPTKKPEDTQNGKRPDKKEKENGEAAGESPKAKEGKQDTPERGNGGSDRPVEGAPPKDGKPDVAEEDSGSGKVAFTSTIDSTMSPKGSDKKYNTSAATGKPSKVPYVSPKESEVNLIGTVAFGKSSQKVQKELNEQLFNSEVVLQELGIKFKQPIDFVCENIKDPKRTQATFQDLKDRFEANDRISIKDRSSGLGKSLVHEIGHAIDFSMTEAGHSASFFSLKRGENEQYQQLKAILEDSPFYKDRSDKGYLAKPTEIFARAFEVYAFDKALTLNNQGKVSDDFVNSFHPDILKGSMKEENLQSTTNVIVQEKLKEAGHLEDYKAMAAETKVIEDSHKIIQDNRAKVKGMNLTDESEENMNKFRKLKEETQREIRKYNKAIDKRKKLGNKGLSKLKASVPHREDEEKIRAEIVSIMSKVLSENPMKKSLDILGLMDKLQKAGAGSRGGQVIGTTRSGKPIYAKAKHKTHKLFTPEDHADAAKMHKQTSDPSNPYWHHKVMSNPEHHAKVKAKEKVKEAKKKTKAIQAKLDTLRQLKSDSEK